MSNPPAPRSQAERREKSRSSLLEAAARGLSKRGYANLSLEEVATEAGYTRGALYHQFRGKEELCLAVVEWVESTWWASAIKVLGSGSDPLQSLRDVARFHAVFCRRDIARVMMTLRVEFSGRDHPVGRAVAAAVERVVAVGAELVSAARERGQIPDGPPAPILARAILGAVEGLVIEISGQMPFDEDLAERVVIGLAGVGVA